MARKDDENIDPENGGLKRAAYPYYPLVKCLSVGQAIYDAGGSRGEVQKSVLAQQLGVDQSSSLFAQLVGATRAFGILTGRGSVSLTNLAKEYFLPTDDGQKQSALLKMLKGPTVFEKLIERFDGSKVPQVDLLTNILRREYNVGESWVVRVASLFLGSLREAAAIDDGGFLRYSALLHKSEMRIPFDSIPNGASSTAMGRHKAAEGNRGTSHASPPVFSILGENPNAWKFSLDGESVLVETSSKLSKALWEKLNQYVQVIKPNDHEPEQSS